MKRSLLIFSVLLLTSCAQNDSNQPVATNATQPPVNGEANSEDIDSVQPISGLSAAEMNQAAQVRFEELNTQFESEMAALKEVISKLETKEEKRRVLIERNPAGVIAREMIINAKKYPGTDGGRDSALFAIGQIQGPRKIETMKLLVSDYTQKVQLKKIVDELKKEIPSPQIEELFQLIIEKSGSDEEKAYSMFGLAEYFSQFPFFRKTLGYNPAYANRIPTEQLEYINRARTQQEQTELANLLRSLINDFGEMPHKRRRTYGDVATSELFELENLQVGQVAPDIEGEDLDGITFRLSDYRGKVVMLDFWGHWCMPCRAMYDHERFMTQELANKPFVLLGVNSDRKLETARQAVRDETLSWRHFWVGEQGTLGPIAKTWNIKAWPTVYLIDEDGVIRYKSVLGEEIDAGIEQLMAEMGHNVELTEQNEAVGAGN